MAGRKMRNIAAIEADLSAVRLDKLADEPAQRAFAGTAFSDNSHDFFFVQLKGNIIDGPERDASPFICFYEMVYFKEHGTDSFLIPARVRRRSV